MASGFTTPLSSTATLSCPPSPGAKAIEFVEESIFSNPRIPASTLIELIASRASISSAVYIYDLAEQLGFGRLTKTWSKDSKEVAPIIDTQTRAGAGLGLIGRLSEQGTSRDTSKGAILTAYTSLQGLASMAPSLAHLPPATVRSRLVIQVPVVSVMDDKLSLYPSFSSFGSSLPLLPENTLVLISATPQEAVDFAALSYGFDDHHVIHLFDHHSSAREIGQALQPIIIGRKSAGPSIADRLSNVGYHLFEYSGDSAATTVIVLLNGPLALTAKAAARRTPGLGVIAVKVPRPWDERALISALPSSVKTVHVFDEVPNAATQGPLYVDVFGSLLGSLYQVKSNRLVPQQVYEYTTKPQTFLNTLTGLADSQSSPIALRTPSLKRLLFFSTPEHVLSTVPQVVQATFLVNSSISTRLLTDHDIFSKQGGISASRIILSQSADSHSDIPISTIAPLSESDSGNFEFLAILDHTLLKTHDFLRHAAPEAAILIIAPWSAEELVANLSANIFEAVAQKSLHIYLLDTKGIVSNLSEAKEYGGVIQNYLVYLAFIRLYLGKAATLELVENVSQTNSDNHIGGVTLDKLNELAWNGLVKAQVPAPDGSSPSILKTFDFNAIVPEIETQDEQPTGVESWHVAAKHLLFPSAYSIPNQAPAALRPELPENTFLVTCTVNRRLTPLEYDRNVFHLEFDTAGTGLKYQLGEALGVHGWNDLDEVLEFCEWYGVDPNRLVTIPVSSDETEVCKLHTRTVLQALQQQIDLFGQPPKSFYSDLAPYATRQSDKYALQFIGSPEGISTFKKMSEKDTVSFVDVLKLYPSAKPSIEVLCGLIGDIKARHYSIASAQAVVGDRVDLLVVAVSWVNSAGVTRYGQCTRYLNSLKVGQKVTVSVRPSVMKLPPSLKQPLILAGLGTGAAPFRAFLQYRAMIKEQGGEVGPAYYYFGSRYQSAEYLYGEEIEAFLLEGIITKAGLAFSRDGPKKVYIQHKMLEDAHELTRMLRNEQGVFYLCGPTWPVPDVYETLVQSMVKQYGMTRESAGDYLEGLKGEERYVLEVYD